MTSKFQKIFTSDVCGTFEEMFRNALAQAEGDGLIKIAVFCYVNSDAEYLQYLAIIKQVVYEHFDSNTPLISYIAQKAYPAEITIEATYADLQHCTAVEWCDDYILLESDGCTELITGGILPCDTSKSIFGQSNEVFGKIGKILLQNRFLPSDICRQWNYIPGITVLNDGSQNYQEFNDARSIFYAGSDWKGGYPAATGIGTTAGGVMVELYAIKGTGYRSLPIDNPVQVAAHSYSQQVLDGKSVEQLGERTTPKFERARLLGNTIFISGTAAIKGECSNRGTDTVEQAAETMEIMNRLIATDNIPVTNNGARYDLLRVYVKRECDIPATREYMQRHYPAVPKHYLVADICRPELLIEIEGIAHI